MKKTLAIIIIAFAPIVLSAQTISTKWGQLYDQESNTVLGADDIRSLFGEEGFMEYDKAYNHFINGMTIGLAGAGIAASCACLALTLYIVHPYLFDVMWGRREYEDWMNRHAGGVIMACRSLGGVGLAMGAVGGVILYSSSRSINSIVQSHNSSLSLNFGITPAGATLALRF